MRALLQTLHLDPVSGRASSLRISLKSLSPNTFLGARPGSSRLTLSAHRTLSPCAMLVQPFFQAVPVERMQTHGTGDDGALVTGEAAAVVTAGGFVVVVADRTGGFVRTWDRPPPCCHCGPAGYARFHDACVMVD